ncbi:MAG: TadE/TadG family type IV pilus assembly protein [Desulfobaccales bacterium]
MAAVEFALLGTMLLFIVAGIIDFGHAWYLKQMITNASREGARYGVAYNVDSTATRVKPNTLSPSIQTYTTSFLPNLSATVPTPTGAGYTSGTKLDPLTVTVNATKTWFVLGGFLPASTLPTTLSASTTMLLE